MPNSNFDEITLFELENATQSTRRFLISQMSDNRRDLLAKEVRCHFENLVDNCHNSKIPYKTIKKYDTIYSLLTGWNLF